MKSVLIKIGGILCLLVCALAQVGAQVRPDNYNDYIMDEANMTKTKLYAASPNSNNKHSEYGGVFTPKGELKILIVFVKFKNHNGPDDIEGYWPKKQAYPNWIKGNDFVFKSPNDFNNIPAYNKSLSRYYYDMTKHLPEKDRFKLYADYLTVEIDPQTSDFDDDRQWDRLVELACDELNKKYTKDELDKKLATCDKRKNCPDYLFDNSVDEQPDNVVDYVAFNFRYSKEKSWSADIIPQNMKKWQGSGGGYTSEKIVNKKVGSYYIRHGMVACLGIKPNVKTYIHEIGHQLYSAPHYGGCNNVLGEYLMTSKLWGMMPQISNEIYAGANAWERWYLGWINIKHDLKDKSQNGTYTIRDYYTTGDAIRIKMPYVDNQYVWLENHQGKTVYEKRWDYGEMLCNWKMPTPPTGLMIYVENLGTECDDNLIENGKNKMRLVNRDGNYDMLLQGYYEKRPEWCDNTLGKFKKNKDNPYSGYSTASNYLSDKNGDGEIDYTTDYNGGPKEQDEMIWVDDQFVYGNFAPNAGFQVGDKIGISTNPAIVNLQKFDNDNQKLERIRLNGISIKVLQKNANGDLTVQIKFDDYVFENDVRMCGDIILPPESITVNAGKIIDVDKSGTPNRTTKLNGQFVNPTIVSTSENTNMTLNSEASIILENESSFVIEKNSTMTLSDASIVVKKGCTLLVKSSATLNVKGKGFVLVEPGGYLCIEKGATIKLNDELSAIRFRNGAKMGVTSNISGVGTYYTTVSAIPYTGRGTISVYLNDVYIQNKTYSSNSYISGKNIYVGNSVSPKITSGNVVVKSGCTLILDAESEVLLDKGVEVQSGAVLETVKY